jgi:uncharacterized protein YidB (DUF937 family)
MGLLEILNSIQTGPSSQPQPARGGSGSGAGMSPIMMALLGLLASKALQGGGLGNILGGGQQPAPGGGQQAPAGGAGRAAPSEADNPGAGGLADILGSLLGGGQPAPGGGQGRVAAPAPGANNPLGDILGSLLGGGQQPAGRAAAPTPGAGGLGDVLGGLLGSGAGGSVLSGGLDKLMRDLQSSGQGDVAKSWVGTGPNKEIEPQNLQEAVGVDTLDALAKQTGMPRDQLLSAMSQYLPNFVDQLTPNGRVPTAQEAQRMV